MNVSCYFHNKILLGLIPKFKFYRRKGKQQYIDVFSYEEQWKDEDAPDGNLPKTNGHAGGRASSHR